MPSSRNSERKTRILPNYRPGWQQELAQALSDPAELLDYLDLDKAWLPAARRAATLFPLRVPRYFADLMRPGDLRDPLLRQVLPLAEELDVVPGFNTDPVSDLAALTHTGLLQKYQGRALLITTGACAVHCRYCFRRHFPYQNEQAGRDNWQEVLQELAARPDITEAILSGGDPLSLSDARLSGLVERLSAIPHLRRLRLHSRLPVVLPSRVTPELVHLLGESRLTTSLVLHANHPAELTDTLGEALKPLRQAGITLLNQSVLLAGVNDQPAVLQQLSEDLYESGILPYYLHFLDPVSGAAHFRVDENRARDLLQTLREHLPGYLVPKLVVEKATAPSKLPL